MRLLLLAVALLAIFQNCESIHDEDIEQQNISMEDYLDQLTESVDNELDGNSMMGHKPPNRWYSLDTKDSTLDKSKNDKLERDLGIILVKHYKYLTKLRGQLSKIINRHTRKLDLWPIIKSNDATDEADGQHHSFGLEQPEWMKHLFDDVELYKLELEELNE